MCGYYAVISFCIFHFFSILFFIFFVHPQMSFFYKFHFFLFTIHKFKSFLLCPTFIHPFIHFYISVFFIFQCLSILFKSCFLHVKAKWCFFTWVLLSSFLFLNFFFFSVLLWSNDSQLLFFITFNLIRYFIFYHFAYSICVCTVHYVYLVWVVCVGALKCKKVFVKEMKKS